MGYSYRTLAGFALDELIQILARRWDCLTTSWRIGHLVCFYETGEEQDDGAIVGQVFSYDPSVENGPCSNGGAFRIEGHGRISSFPTATVVQCSMATAQARERFVKTYGRAQLAKETA